MDVGELPDYLRSIQARVASAAPDAAMSMAKAYHRYLTQVTLRRFSHPIGAWTNSPPGQPPARVTGALSDTVAIERSGRTTTSASARVYPTVIYSRIQELGGDIFPVRKKWLHWINEGGEFFSRGVRIPRRSYMKPTTEETIRSGVLTDAATESFVRSTGLG